MPPSFPAHYFWYKQWACALQRNVKSTPNKERTRQETPTNNNKSARSRKISSAKKIKEAKRSSSSLVPKACPAATPFSPPPPLSCRPNAIARAPRWAARSSRAPASGFPPLFRGRGLEGSLPRTPRTRRRLHSPTRSSRSRRSSGARWLRRRCRCQQLQQPWGRRSSAGEASTNAPLRPKKGRK